MTAAVHPKSLGVAVGRPDPFYYDHTKHSGPLQLIKMVVVGLFLFPLRVIVFVMAFFMMWFTALLATCCFGDPSLPQSIPVSSFFFRLWARLILLSLGYWWIIVNGRSDPRARIVVANHPSYVEAFYFAYALLPMPVAKEELVHVPFLGTIAKYVQAIAVKRDASDSRQSVADEIKRRARWGLDGGETGQWPPLLIFPEGMCVNSSCVLDFKLGAFAPLVDVQPIVIDVRQSALDVSWVGNSSIACTTIRMMCQVYNRMEISYLPLIGPGDDGARGFADRAQAHVANGLRVECCSPPAP